MKNLFSLLQEVVHIETGLIFKIYGVPENHTIIAELDEPFYQYQGDDQYWHIRGKTTMEDGRFEAS